MGLELEMQLVIRLTSWHLDYVKIDVGIEYNMFALVMLSSQRLCSLPVYTMITVLSTRSQSPYMYPNHPWLKSVYCCDLDCCKTTSMLENQPSNECHHSWYQCSLSQRLCIKQMYHWQYHLQQWYEHDWFAPPHPSAQRPKKYCWIGLVDWPLGPPGALPHWVDAYSLWWTLVVLAGMNLNLCIKLVKLQVSLCSDQASKAPSAVPKILISFNIWSRSGIFSRT